MRADLDGPQYITDERATGESVREDAEREAWIRWFERVLARLPRKAARVLDGLPRDAAHARWVQAARRAPGPVAAAVQEWLIPADVSCLVVPGTAWDGTATATGVVLAYPEAFDNDPLALAGLSVHAWRLGAVAPEVVVERLSLGLVAVAERLGAGDVRSHPAFAHAVATFRGWFEAAGRPHWARSLADWAGPGPAVASADPDDVTLARDLLLLGLPPHRPPDEPVLAPGAILLALATLGDTADAGTLALAAKGLEGAVLTRQWREAAQNGCG
jgi:hypothetical protein